MCCAYLLSWPVYNFKSFHSKRCSHRPWELHAYAFFLVYQDERSRRWWARNLQRYITIPKKDVEFEKEAAHVRIIEAEILALPGARIKALLRSRRSPRRAWLNLIIIVSLMYTHTYVCYVCEDACALLVTCVRASTRKCKSRQPTYYSRWTQHSHLVRDVWAVIFNTSLSASVSSSPTDAFWRNWDYEHVIEIKMINQDYFSFFYPPVVCNDFSTRAVFAKKFCVLLKNNPNLYASFNLLLHL